MNDFLSNDRPTGQAAPGAPPSGLAGVSNHDRILIALTNKDRVLELVRATHALDQWATWARESSEADLREGISLVENERDRLIERQRLARSRPGAIDAVRLAATQAECDRVAHRLEELEHARRHLDSLFARISDQVDVDTVELQRPVTNSTGDVVGFVDLWVTLRVSYWRVTRGTDFGDHERRVRYEGTNSQHLTRSFAIVVATRPASVAATLRQIRTLQTYARDGVPILVCPPTPHRDIFAGQGVGVFEWTDLAVTAASTSPRPPRLGMRRQRRDAGSPKAAATPDLVSSDTPVRRPAPPRTRARR